VQWVATGAMGYYSCSGATTFREAMSACVVLTAFGSVWPADAMSVGVTLCSNYLSTTYCAIIIGAIHAYINPRSLSIQTHFLVHSMG